MILFTVKIKNLPDYKLKKYIVARLVDGELWFYGTWEDKEEADRVAREFENGLVVENET